MYKLHLKQFPRSLRPSFPTAFLDFDFPIDSGEYVDFEEGEYFERLKERLEHFFRAFFEVCGVELESLREYHQFIDCGVEVNIH